MSKQYVITEQKDHSNWWIILVASIIVAYGTYILYGAIAVVVCFIVYQLLKWDHSRKEAKRAEEAKAWMYDETKLITEGMPIWGCPEHYLDNYDDGMREWP
jgi:hypothetical protein